MSTERRSIFTGFLVVLLVFSFALMAAAAPASTENNATAPSSLAQAPGAVAPEAPGTQNSGDGNVGPAVPEEQLEQPQPYVSKDSVNHKKVPASGKESELAEPAFATGEAVKGNVATGAYPVAGAETVVMTAREQQMFDLVNQERAKAGVPALQANATLLKIARLKAQDMADLNYFSHNSPTYGSPFDMLKKFGVTYSYAGENIARAGSVTTAHNALMQSSGHRANILNRNFDKVGIGIVAKGYDLYFVQLFTGGQRESQPEAPGTGDNTGTQPPADGSQPGDNTGTQPPADGSQPGDNTGTQPPADGSQPGSGTGGTDPDTVLSSDEQLMFDLINQERAKLGVPALKSDALLIKVAGLKARDMAEKNYVSHTSPTYGSLYNMLRQFGVSYKYAGENLALSTSVTRAHNSLMKSSGNMANIVAAKYDKVGVGIVTKGSYMYFVQIYTGGETTPANPAEPGTGTGQQPQQPQPGDTSVSQLSADEQKMLNLVNAERQKRGLAPLKINLKLAEVARIKAKDMIDKNYFSHTSPTYGSPFDMMKKFGITYRTAGENLAGAPTVDMAHTNLMNSDGHRANILNSSFKEVGIGIVNGGPYGKMFVQMFIG